MTHFSLSAAWPGLCSTRRSAAAMALAGTVLALIGAPAIAQQQTLTMWSHWPDEASKRSFIEERVKQFEAATRSARSICSSFRRRTSTPP